jgi:hypothetical protein
MNPRALLLPTVPLLLAGLGWWGADSLAKQTVKAQAVPNVPQITLPAGIEALAPVTSRQPLGFQELSAFGFTEPPKKVVIKTRIPTASDLYVVDSVLLAPNQNSATIGGKTLQAGDKLDARYTVTSVESDGVWVKGSRQRDKPEKIGFRPYAAVAETGGNAVAPNPAGATSASAPAATGPVILPGQRDFRQILETLKL